MHDISYALFLEHLIQYQSIRKLEGVAISILSYWIDSICCDPSLLFLLVHFQN